MKIAKNAIPVNSQSTQSQRVDSKKYIPKQILDVAKGYEKQFVKLMVEQMQKTAKSEAPNSTGMDYYMDLQTEERTKTMVERDQVGLQDLILDKIYPKERRNIHTYNHVMKMYGQPIKKQTIEMNNQQASDYQDIELHKVNSNKNGLNGLGSEARND